MKHRARTAGRRLTGPGGSVALVVILLGAVLGAAVAIGPASAGSEQDELPVRQVSVARATATCPAPVADSASVTRVSVASSGPLGLVGRQAAEGGESAGGDLRGGVTLSPAQDGAQPLLTLQAPDSGSVEPSPAPAEPDPSGSPPAQPAPDEPDSADTAPTPGPVPLIARASGSSAPGLAASQLTRSTDATMRGLAGGTCSTSGTDFWFVGSGAEVGQRGRVYLTNPEPAPAVVDVRLYGPDGPIRAPDARGVTVGAGEQEVRLLDALAPGVPRFAIHVHARQGRVAAAVRDLQIDGLVPQGADWVPSAAAPARSTIVPGVPGGPGERHLQVIAPGDADAVVRVRLVSGSGTEAPADLDVIEVAAGSVGDVDIAPFTGGSAVSVRLDSDVPVTAGVLARVAGSAGQLSELTYAAAGRPLRPEMPGVVAEIRQGEAVTSRLLLTAPGTGATVRLATLPPGPEAPMEVRVPAGTQTVVDPTALSEEEVFALTVVPSPGSGPVLAVRQVEEMEARGPFVTSNPVEPGRFVVPVPRVVADLSTGLR